VIRAALAAATLLLVSACGGDAPPPAKKPPPVAPPVADPRASVEISQIMIAYAPKRPRTHDEAFAAAERLIRRAKAGEKFENLILEATDDRDDDTHEPFNGGTYTLALRGRADPVLIKYVQNLRVGEIGDVPYDSGQALLVVRRDR
jgi:hypothetical protein